MLARSKKFKAIYRFPKLSSPGSDNTKRKVTRGGQLMFVSGKMRTKQCLKITNGLNWAQLDYYDKGSYKVFAFQRCQIRNESEEFDFDVWIVDAPNAL